MAQDDKMGRNGITCNSNYGLLSMVVRRTTAMGFSLPYFLNLKLAFSFAIVSYIYIYFHLSTLQKKKRQKKFISFSWF
jgi:hypothetical protein